MISTFIKIPLFFLCSFIILSIPINGESVYLHLDSNLNLYTKKIIEIINQKVQKTINRGKMIGSQLFSNSVPTKIPEIPIQQEYLQSIKSKIPLISSFNLKKYLNSEVSIKGFEEVAGDEHEQVQSQELINQLQEDRKEKIKF